METLRRAHLRAHMCESVPVSERSTVSGGRIVTVAMCVKRVGMKLRPKCVLYVKLHPNAGGGLWAFFIFNHSSFWAASRLCGGEATALFVGTRKSVAVGSLRWS